MKLLSLVFILLCSIYSLNAKSETTKLNVFIDCPGCDQTFIRQELTYLSYVRDRLLSDVHVQIVSQTTGSGGEEYTFFFYGIGDLAGNNDTLTMTTDVNNTWDEIRQKQVKIIQLGLIKYMVMKGYTDQITMNFASIDSVPEIQEKDPWNNWVVEIQGDGWFSGEKQSNNLNLSGGLDVDRVTENWKWESSIWYNYNKGQYYFEEDTVISERRSTWIDASLVKSLGEHFSAGIFASHYSSLFDNYKVNLSLAPSFEYNIYPYSESSKRQIRFTYRVGGRHNIYNEETVYNRLEETLFYENLGVAARFQEKWGAVSLGVDASHYFHNFSINRVNFNVNLNLRIFKGFSWRIGGNLALIHDQISLPAGDATEEDVLLSQRQLQTGYRMWMNTGISYTFGSIYNSVVNPRFGN